MNLLYIQYNFNTIQTNQDKKGQVKYPVLFCYIHLTTNQNLYFTLCVEYQRISGAVILQGVYKYNTSVKFTEVLKIKKQFK